MNESHFGVRMAGPLALHADGFRGWLIERWYSPLTAVGQLRLMAHLGRWLASEGVECSALTDEVAEQFLRARRAAGYRSLVSWAGLAPLLRYLRQFGVAPAAVQTAPGTPMAQLLEDYRGHLIMDRRLTEGTVQAYLTVVARFLACCAARGADELSAVTAAQITDFVLAEAARRPSGSARQAVPPLRSLLRYCQLRGLTPPGLALAVPTAPSHRDATLPHALSARQLTRLLASCDRRTAMGRRDYAMLVALSRLGLRAGELVALELDDLDWRAGEIDVPGKGGRRERLPLPEDVGQALVAYLRRGRPQTRDRHLFVRHDAPRTGLSSGAVTAVVKRAGQRAGIAMSGAHQLRHTAAGDLLRAGAPLSEIAQLLRHRRQATTMIYAKVDQAALRPLAACWPAGAR